jgi:DNA transformation protein and related proteins
MADDDEFAAYCAELLSVAGPVKRRRMFGGHGLYVNGLFVAIIAFGRLYLKADAATTPQFEAAGGERFVYEAQGKTAALNYWTVPEAAMESPPEMRPWVRLAMQAALAAQASKRPKSAAPPAARKPSPARRPRRATRCRGPATAAGRARARHRPRAPHRHRSG